MFHNSPTDARARPLGRNFMVRALLPWDMFFNAMTRRKTRFLLSALDDHLLKDIGISRGEIDRIARDTAGEPGIARTARQPTPTITQLNQRRTTMTTKTATSQKPARTPVAMNGVDTPTLLATINAVGGQPELAKFQFRAKSRWISGTHSQSTMEGFFGAGGEHKHKAAYKADGDHPAVLCGVDNGPTPVEWVLHALASCLTSGIANIASARGIKLRKVESTVEGDIDLRGILGLSDKVRNGYQGIRVTFDIDSPADDADVAKVVEQSMSRSAVLDVLTNGPRVAVEIAS